MLNKNKTRGKIALFDLRVKLKIKSYILQKVSKQK
jgi:hypothetical protein